MFIWHLMIYKPNFGGSAIDRFFQSIADNRDSSGLHYKKLTVDSDTADTITVTLIFTSQEPLTPMTLQQIAKFMYAQLMTGPKLSMPVFARVLREDLKTLGIEWHALPSGEYDVTFWGVAPDTAPND